MRIVVALGGNALLRRGEPLSVETQRANVRIAARALAPIASRHELLVTHGNGPQVGLLALQTESYREVAAYPLDVLGAATEGMIGYLIEQELRNQIPGREVTTVLTLVEVDPDDAAFEQPSKPIGPSYSEEEARLVEKAGGGPMVRDGDRLRRVVPSPRPLRVLGVRAIETLLDAGFIVVCAGGGGIPTAVSRAGLLHGVEAVIDKDRASALLALEVRADMLILATDVGGVYENFGEEDERLVSRISKADVERLGLDRGSMGPKVEAAFRFAAESGGRAAIGSLAELEDIIAGKAGSLVEAS